MNAISNSPKISPNSFNVDRPVTSSGREDVAHLPGELKQHSEVSNHKVMLDSPLTEVNGKISEVLNKLDLDTWTLLLIWQANKDAKKTFMTIKSTEALSSIEAKKAQVAEVFEGANWMIGGAVCTGLTSVLSFGAGTYGFLKSLSGSSQEKMLKLGIADAEKKLAELTPPSAHSPELEDALSNRLAARPPKLDDLLGSKSKPCDMVGHDLLNDSVSKAKTGLEQLNEQATKRTHILDLLKSGSASLNGVLGASFQTKQTFIQGDSKANDVEAGIHDANKQKAADMIKALEDSQKELVQLIKEITDIVNQAMRSANRVA